MMAVDDSFSMAIDNAVREGDASRRLELAAMSKLNIEQRLDWLFGRVRGLSRDDLAMLFEAEIDRTTAVEASPRRHGIWRRVSALVLCVAASAYVTDFVERDDFVANLARQNGGDIALHCRNEGRVVKIVPGNGEVEMCVLKMKGGGRG